MNIVRYVLIGIMICHSAFGADRKGVQLVGLSKMSNASARNCATAIRESGCREIEFAFMPFFNPGNPFNNVGTILNVPNVNKVETIFLSWRDESVMKGAWSNTLATLRFRARSVNAHVNGVRNSVTKIILVPMLEDAWTDAQWMEAVHAIAANLDNGTKIYFRRSDLSGKRTPPSSIATRLMNRVPHTFTSTKSEAHRMDHGGSAHVISNDGGFVYQNSPIGGKFENESSFPNAPGGYGRLADWTSGANASTKVSLLWRPSYNIIKRTGSGNLIRYEKRGTLDQRNDSETDPAFNSFEIKVLKSFLR